MLISNILDMTLPHLACKPAQSATKRWSQHFHQQQCQHHRTDHLSSNSPVSISLIDTTVPCLQDRSVRPTDVTYNALLNAGVKSRADPERLRELLTEMQEARLVPNERTYTALISGEGPQSPSATL